jgi:putative spermidine/putrescine transport system substrate-binding protein
MTHNTYGPVGKLNRRRLLKGAAAGGAVAATGAIGGFPTVWAQNTKDVTLVVAGGSYAVIKEIGEQAAKDLGFKLVMQAITDDVQINRSITQPNTIDVNNIDSTKMPLSRRQGRAHADPVVEVQAMGRHRAAVHQERLSQRAAGLEPGPVAVQLPVLRRQGRQEAREPRRPSS